MTNVNVNSTTKAANAELSDIAACKFPWYPGTVTLQKKKKTNKN